MKKVSGEFIRYGNLTRQYHKIPKDDNERTFHTAPVNYGIYAFPKGFIETFLIGGVGEGSLQNGRYRKLRDKNGKPVKVAYDDYENFIANFPNKKLAMKFRYAKPDVPGEEGDIFESLEDYENYWREHGPYEVWIHNNPIHFKYSGLIWHHLFSEDYQLDKEFPNYIKISGDWVLTDMSTYLRCLNKEVGKIKYGTHIKNKWFNTGEEVRKFGPNFNYGGAPMYTSKDHFEVFIENIQNELLLTLFSI